MTSVFVASLAFAATENDIRQHFAACGNIVGVKLPISASGKSKGSAYVDFDSEQAAAAACKLNGTSLVGREIRVDISARAKARAGLPQEPVARGASAGAARGGASGSGRSRNGAGGGARQPRAARGATEKPAGCTTVYVGDLSYQADESMLRQAFGACGTIVNVRIAVHRDSGRSKGFAHIEFQSTEATDAAVALTGVAINERAVRVDYAPPLRDVPSAGAVGAGRS